MFVTVLEGPDITGKSTVAQELKIALEAQGLRVRHLHEPDSNSEFRKQIRELVLNNDCSALTQALLMYASRNDLFEEINAQCDQYDALIIERSYISTWVYQGKPEYKMLFDELTRLTTSYPANTYFYLLTCDPETARKRRSSNVYDKIEEKVLASDNAYRDLTERYKHAAPYARNFETQFLTSTNIVNQIMHDIQRGGFHECIKAVEPAQA